MQEYQFLSAGLVLQLNVWNVKLISDKTWFNLSLPPVHCEQAHFDRKCFSCSCQRLPCHVQVAWPDLDCDPMPLSPLMFNKLHVFIHSCVFVYIFFHLSNAFLDLRTKIPQKRLSLLLSCENRRLDQCFLTFLVKSTSKAPLLKVNYLFTGTNQKCFFWLLLYWKWLSVEAFIVSPSSCSSEAAKVFLHWSLSNQSGTGMFNNSNFIWPFYGEFKC